MKLKLNEIVWEITNKCDNQCHYCGSRHITNNPTVIDHKKIIDAIAEYPPNTLDVSGGDPLLVDYGIHQYLREKLRTVSCHIVINPLSLRYKLHKAKIVNLYNRVGVSLNTEEEIRAFGDVSDKISAPITFITNFSLLNLYLVDSLSLTVGNSPWQVQFTMSDDPYITIHDKPKALEMLNAALGKRRQHGWPVVVADNANHGECKAGINSMGILYNGLVVPCLSMRSWCKELTTEIQGDLNKEDLKTIWTTKFESRRFDDCRCCKDFCSKAKIEITLPKVEGKMTTTQHTDWLIMDRGEFRQVAPQVTVYAVFSPNDFTYQATPIYAVSGGTTRIFNNEKGKQNEDD